MKKPNPKIVIAIFFTIIHKEGNGYNSGRVISIIVFYPLLSGNCEKTGLATNENDIFYGVVLARERHFFCIAESTPSVVLILSNGNIIILIEVCNDILN